MVNKNINLRDVDPKLHKDFKHYCEYRGHTMSWVLKRLMKAYISDTKKAELRNGQKGEQLE